jgi:hypothetical protein
MTPPKALSGKRRPRLWVPGVAYVTDECEIRAGRHVGYNGWGRAFRLSGCGHFASIAEWRHRVWVVERAALSARVIDEHAIILAERLIDKEAQPNARRWLAEQPLVCVSGAKVKRLANQGLRVYCVEHGVERSDWFAVKATGGNRAGWELSGPVEAFWPARANQSVPDDPDELPLTERYDVRIAIDRLLRFLSRGKLTEVAVANAFGVRKLLTPGYGYHGATDGTVASVGQVQHDLRPLEALFEQIYDRAATMSDQARGLANAIDCAPHRADDVAVPDYGSAHRMELPELTIGLATDDEHASSQGRWLVNDEPQAELTLPIEDRWIVEQVDLWSPELPSELAAELEQKERSPERRGSSSAMVILVLVLVAAVVWLLFRLL